MGIGDALTALLFFFAERPFFFFDVPFLALLLGKGASVGTSTELEPGGDDDGGVCGVKEEWGLPDCDEIADWFVASTRLGWRRALRGAFGVTGVVVGIATVYRLNK